LDFGATRNLTILNHKGEGQLMENGVPGNLGLPVVRSVGVGLDLEREHAATQPLHLEARLAWAPSQCKHQNAIPMSAVSIK